MLGAQFLDLKLGAAAIRSGLQQLVSNYEADINALLLEMPAELGVDHFAQSFLRLANADGHAALRSAELTLPALVSGDAEIRKASSEAKIALKTMFNRTYSRSDLCAHLKCAAALGLRADKEEQRLVDVILAKFAQSGANIEDDGDRADVARLDARCSELSFSIEQAINEDVTEVLCSAEELEGCPEDFLSGLPVASDGRLRCSLKAPVLGPIVTRAIRGETRRKMFEASGRQCRYANAPLLDQLIATRHEAAVKLGFPCHAERMISQKMAGSLSAAQTFVEDMLARLAPLRDLEMVEMRARKGELAEMRGRKRKLEGDAGDDVGDAAGEVQVEDTRFLAGMYLDCIAQLYTAPPPPLLSAQYSVFSALCLLFSIACCAHHDQD
jgi:Zn-dependent oligopeptidase